MTDEEKARLALAQALLGSAGPALSVTDEGTLNSAGNALLAHALMTHAGASVPQAWLTGVRPSPPSTPVPEAPPPATTVSVSETPATAPPAPAPTIKESADAALAPLSDHLKTFLAKEEARRQEEAEAEALRRQRKEIKRMQRQLEKLRKRKK